MLRVKRSLVMGHLPKVDQGRETQVSPVLRPLQVNLSFLLYPSQGLNFEIIGKRAVGLLA